MRITAKVDYAVRAVVQIAASGEGPVKGASLASAQSIPRKFLESILGDLRRAGIVASQRGADGGYRLGRSADTVAVADIIRAVEGPLADVHGEPPESISYAGPAVPLQQVWLATRATLRDVLETTTIADIAADDLPPPVVALAKRPDAQARR
jgi:Rrf2 family protein